MTSLLVIAALALAANHGITVNGTATTRIPATSARISLNLTTADRKLTLDSAALRPVVDALVKAGADPQSVHLPLNFAAPGSSNLASIVATIDHPTVQQMQAGIVLVGAAIAEQRNLVLTNAQVQLTADDCGKTVEEVRRDAVRHARAKAESLASDLGVHVGSAINVNSFDPLASDGSCSWQYYVNGYGNFSNPQSPQKPGDYVTVPVTENVSITYAIK